MSTPIPTPTTVQNALARLAFEDTHHSVPLAILLSGFYADGQAVLPAGVAATALGRRKAQTTRYLDATREDGSCGRPASRLWAERETTTRRMVFGLTEEGQKRLAEVLHVVAREQDAGRVLRDGPILGQESTVQEAMERWGATTLAPGAGMPEVTPTRGALFAASLMHKNPKHAWLTGTVLSEMGEDCTASLDAAWLRQTLGYSNERSMPVFLRAVSSQGLLDIAQGEAGEVTASLTMEGMRLYRLWWARCEAVAQGTTAPQVA